jgi:tellurite resistance protein TerC
MVRASRLILPLDERPAPSGYVTRVNGRFAITILGLALIAIEGTDLIFAIDSIPAVFAVTRDPFLVYTSNISAILGLRSLYFLLVNPLQSMVYLNQALAAILIFVGIKIIAEPYLGETFHQHSSTVSLIVLSSILLVAIVGSKYFPPKKNLKAFPE